MPRRAVAQIDGAAIAANCRRLRRELDSGTELCAVVKANGYGHGMLTTARAAFDGGVDRLAVATASEVEELAAAMPGARVFTLGALTREGFDMAIARGAEVAVWNEEGMQMAAAAAARQGGIARVHIKHDSGMGRYGVIDPGETVELARACADQPQLELGGLWTHFATADEDDEQYFRLQLDRFAEVAATLRSVHPQITVHAANSAAMLRTKASHFDMVRCGIAIYGLDPFGRDAPAQDLRSALTLKSYVAAVRRFRAGSSAGYGRTWKADRDTWVATLPIGYGDGVLRVNSNNGDVLIQGRRYPIVGNVSMDNITVDLGDETDVSVGNEAVLIGGQGDERISAEEVATRIGTINYEVTTGLSARVSREDP